MKLMRDEIHWNKRMVALAMCLLGMVMRAVPNGVSHILRTRPVLKVFRPVVLGVTVQVASLKPVWSWPIECGSDQSVNRGATSGPASSEVADNIALLVLPSLQQAPTKEHSTSIGREHMAINAAHAP